MSLSNSREDSLEIPGYRIIRKIGLGGMSTVYLAEQMSLQREVALKVLSPVLVKDKDYCERLLKEGKLVASLRHPNIVTIFDLGQFEDKYYFSMEYISGGTLRDVTKRQALPERQAVKIFTELTKTVDFAHFKGIIHRDIKPHNILFRDDNTLVLTDFGIAIDTSDEEEESKKVIHASPRYMSPEQVRKKDTSKSTDIYSMGIIFYEMLTGSVPFDGADMKEIAKKHLNYPIPKVPDHLSHYQRLIDWLLAKKVEDRVPDTATLLDRLALVERKRLEAQHTQGEIISKVQVEQRANATTAEIPVKNNSEDTMVVNPGFEAYFDDAFESGEKTEEIVDDIDVDTQPDMIKPEVEDDGLEKTMLISDDMIDDIEKAIENDEPVKVATPAPAPTSTSETPFKVVSLNAQQKKVAEEVKLPEPEKEKKPEPVKAKSKQQAALVSLEPDTEEMELMIPKRAEKLTATRDDSPVLINDIDDELLDKNANDANNKWPVFAAIGMFALLGIFLWATFNNKKSLNDNVIPANNDTIQVVDNTAQLEPIDDTTDNVVAPQIEGVAVNDVVQDTPAPIEPKPSQSDRRTAIFLALQNEVDKGRVDLGIERLGSGYRISVGLENALAKYTSSIFRPSTRSLSINISGPDIYVPGEALLSNGSVSTLQQIAFVLRNHNGYRVVVIDRTQIDNSPQSSSLSLARANAVKTYLASNGVSRAKISARPSNNILAPASIDIILEPVI